MNEHFKKGFFSVFGINPKNQIRERIPNLTTEERIERNWRNVGSDIRKSMNDFKEVIKS